MDEDSGPEKKEPLYDPVNEPAKEPENISREYKVVNVRIQNPEKIEYKDFEELKDYAAKKGIMFVEEKKPFDADIKNDVEHAPNILKIPSHGTLFKSLLKDRNIVILSDILCIFTLLFWRICLRNSFCSGLVIILVSFSNPE